MKAGLLESDRVYGELVSTLFTATVPLIIMTATYAVTSARRLRGHPVYKDTLTYWTELLQEARRVRKDLEGSQLRALEAAILNLEGELADRPV